MTELAVTCHMWILQLARNKQTLYMHQSVVKVYTSEFKTSRLKKLEHITQWFKMTELAVTCHTWVLQLAALSQQQH